MYNQTLPAVAVATAGRVVYSPCCRANRCVRPVSAVPGQADPAPTVGAFYAYCADTALVTVPLCEEGQRGGALLATTGALAPQRSAFRPAQRRGSGMLQRYVFDPTIAVIETRKRTRRSVPCRPYRPFGPLIPIWFLAKRNGDLAAAIVFYWNTLSIT